MRSLVVYAVLIAVPAVCLGPLPEMVARWLGVVP